MRRGSSSCWPSSAMESRFPAATAAAASRVTLPTARTRRSISEVRLVPGLVYPLVRVVRAFRCPVSQHPLHPVIRRSFAHSRLRPTLHGRGALGGEVKLPQQRAAVVHQYPLLHPHQLYPLRGQRLAHIPAPARQVQLALAPQSFHFCALRILPGRRVGIVLALAHPPARRRRLHVQRFVRPHIVVLIAKLIQPARAQLRYRQSPPPPRHLQGSVKPFYLTLRLGVPNPAEQALDALLHQPYL